MIKRILAVITVCFLLIQWGAVTVAAANDAGLPELKAESAVLLEQKSGKVLFEKDAHKKMYPASTTKNLTALLALENLTLEDVITVGTEVNSVSLDSSSAGLRNGEKITVRNLLYALMLPSGNDAAQTIAVQVARKKANNASMSIEDALKSFSELMNQKAREIGCKDTNFTNPDGYHDENHYTTAYDLALISREVMKNDLFREIVKTQEYSIKDAGLDAKFHKQTIPWVNKNELINKRGKYYYQFATGIKTGHTSDAGYCLTSAASKDGLDVIAVVLKCEKEIDRWIDTKALLEYGLTNFKVHTVLQKGQTVASVKVGKKFFNKTVDLAVVSNSEFTDVLQRKDIENIQQAIEWNKQLVDQEKAAKGETRLLGPIVKDQVVGKVTYSLNGNVLVQSDLIATQTVMERNLLDRILEIGAWLYKFKIIVLGIVAAAVVAIVILRLRSSGNKRGRYGKYLD